MTCLHKDLPHPAESAGVQELHFFDAVSTPITLPVRHMTVTLASMDERNPVIFAPKRGLDKADNGVVKYAPQSLL